MDLTLRAERLTGALRLPPSKSLSHRALITAALADGTSVIRGVLDSDDLEATRAALAALGGRIEPVRDGDEVPGASDWRVTGPERADPRSGATVAPVASALADCIESGSTLRFLLPLATVLSRETRFLGRGRLGTRPLDTFESLFTGQGLTWGRADDGASGALDLTVTGRLRPGDYELPGDISSQFVSGLLMTLPLLAGDSTVRLTTDLQSVGYVDLTLDALAQAGMPVEQTDARTWAVRGGRRAEPGDRTVEGDWSQAAFLLVANALGGDVALQNLNHESRQGDRIAVDVLTRMGATGGGTAHHGGPLSGTVIDASDCPDVIPVLTVAAALAHGRTEIRDAARLRIKESDRLEATATELNALGARIEEHEDALIVDGLGTADALGTFPGGADVDARADHRMAMMLGIAATRSGAPVRLTGAESVNKSWPRFWDDYRALGGVAEQA